MTETAPYTQIPASWPAVADDVIQLSIDRALSALSNDSTRPVVDRLVDYYDVDRDYVGASFTEIVPNKWDDVTAADLHAVSLMNVRIGARATRRLLSGAERTWVVEALKKLPDQELVLAGPAALEAMYDFYSAVKNALSDPDARTSNRWVAASKLTARKRPDLFPVRDRVVCEHLGILGLKDVRLDWQVFRAVIQDDQVLHELRQLADALTQASPERPVAPETNDLRLLDAALWTYARHGIPQTSLEEEE